MADLKDLVFAFILGGLFLGYVVWVPAGRELAIKAVSRGAKVAESKVREWVEKGE